MVFGVFFKKNNTEKSKSGNPFGRSGDAASGAMLDIRHEITTPVESDAISISKGC
jgi:hypothetical protein